MTPPGAAGHVGRQSAFTRQVVAAPPVSAPSKVVTLPASAWSSMWVDRPVGDAEVGLRRYAEADAVLARARASQIAWSNHPQQGDEDERIQTWNGTMMAWIVAVSCCEPADQSKAFFGTRQIIGGDKVGAEGVVPRALTPQGIEFLFREIDTMLAEEAPTSPEASDEDIAAFVAALNGEAPLASLGVSSADERRVRRLLGTVFELVRGEG